MRDFAGKWDVLKYCTNIGAHKCRHQATGVEFWIDLFIDGTMDNDDTFENVAGKTVELDGAQPWLLLATNSRVANTRVPDIGEEDDDRSC